MVKCRKCQAFREAFKHLHDQDASNNRHLSITVQLCTWC